MLDTLSQFTSYVVLIEKDFLILQIWGGDLNALPDMNPANSPYRIMASYMRDSLLEVYGPGASDDPRFFTYGNRRNSFSSDTVLSPPVLAKVYLMQEDLEFILKTTHQSPVKFCQSKLDIGTKSGHLPL